MHICLFGLYDYPTDRATPLRIQREAEALNELGHDTAIICNNADFDEHNGVRYESIDSGADVQDLGVIDASRLFAASHWSAARHLKDIDPDIVHGVNLNSSIFSATLAMRLGIPHVFEPHANIAEEGIVGGHFSRGSVMHRIVLGTRSFVINRSRMVVTLSSVYREELERQHPDPVYRNVPGGVPDEFFQSYDPPAEIDPDLCNLLYAGNFKRYQGLHTLIDALQESATADIEDIQLHLVGYTGAPERITGKLDAVGDDRINVIEDVASEDIPRYMANADMLLSTVRGIPANQYRYPSKLSFYLAQPAPLVVTDVNDQTRTIQDGDFGVSVPPDDPGALGEAIADLYDDPARREELGRAGQEFAREHLTWTELCKRIEDGYREIV